MRGDRSCACNMSELGAAGTGPGPNLGGGIPIGHAGSGTLPKVSVARDFPPCLSRVPAMNGIVRPHGASQRLLERDQSKCGRHQPRLPLLQISFDHRLHHVGITTRMTEHGIRVGRRTRTKMRMIRLASVCVLAASALSVPVALLLTASPERFGQHGARVRNRITLSVHEFGISMIEVVGRHFVRHFD